MWKEANPVVAVMLHDGEPVVMMSTDSSDTHVYPTVKAGPKRPLRFTVGEPDCRSTIWRLFANANLDDVYLASRHSAGEFKVSLHQSGDWRLQTVRPNGIRIKMFGEAPEGRALMRWQRPAAEETGWTFALSIVVPAGHLLNVPPEPWEDVQWIAAPREGHHVELLLHLVRPDLGGVAFGPLLDEVSATDFTLVNALRLPGGEVAVVLAITAPIEAVEATNIALYEDHGASLPHEFPDFDMAPAKGPRHLGMGANDRGEPRLYDLALGVRTIAACDPPTDTRQISDN